MSDSVCFKQLQDKSLPSHVSYVRWSPKMDLIAMATEEGEIWLYRLSWQKVWTIAAEGNQCKINCFAWQPDGRVLAVGRSDGHVRFYDVEKGNILINWSQWKGLAPVILMDWIDVLYQETPASSQFLIDPISTYAPELPLLLESGSASIFNDSTNQVILDKWLNTSSATLLIVGYQDGKIHILQYGLYLIFAIDIRRCHDAFTNVKLFNIISCCYSNATSTFSIIFGVAPNNAGSLENHEVIVNAVYDVTMLTKHKRQLTQVARRCVSILSLLEYLNYLCNSMKENWEDIKLTMDSRLHELAKTIGIRPGDTVYDQFLLLFTRGITSAEMETFLTKDLSLRNYRKLKQSIENSHTKIYDLAVKLVLNVWPTLLLHLLELKGIFNQPQFPNAVVNFVNGCVCNVGSLILKGQELIEVINNSSRRYNAFFKWLTIEFNHHIYAFKVLARYNEDLEVIDNQLNKEERTSLMEFLQELLPENESYVQQHFVKERIGQYFLERDLEIVQDNSNTYWSKLAQEIPELKTLDSAFVYQHYPEKSLIQLFNQLQENFREIVATSTLQDVAISIKPAFLFPVTSKYILVIYHLTLPIASCCVLKRSLFVLYPHSISREDRCLNASQSIVEINGEDYIYGIYQIPERATSLLVIRQKDVARDEEIDDDICWNSVEAALINLKNFGNSVLSEDARILDFATYREDQITTLLFSNDHQNSLIGQLSLTEVGLSDSHQFTTFNVEMLNSFFGEHFIDNTKTLLDKSLKCYEANLTYHYKLIKFSGGLLDVSGSRRVGCILSKSKRRICFLDMEAEDEEAYSSENVSMEDLQND
ncbi:Anaphase-promoting complex subunit 4 [Trichoplax sp. H2]|nr:Anaphase-promoting complex subunit 4 [Trichoplax sp. H2]|eukprot:RDD42907.1 Anaphase-promoting complex subunit 4 [Trichoplax sp. H2]